MKSTTQDDGPQFGTCKRIFGFRGWVITEHSSFSVVHFQLQPQLQVAASSLSPYLLLGDDSAGASPAESDYSMKRELEPELMPPTGSQVDDTLNGTRAARVQQMRGQLAVLKEALLPQRDGFLEML